MEARKGDCASDDALLSTEAMDVACLGHPARAFVLLRYTCCHVKAVNIVSELRRDYHRLGSQNCATRTSRRVVDHDARLNVAENTAIFEPIGTKNARNVIPARNYHRTCPC
jgi:hypothetical protein